MSQQYAPTTGQQSTQQMQGPSMGGAQQDGGQLPQQQRQALESVAQAAAVCGWCADQCIKTADPGMIECIRMCEDVVEIGETLLAVAPRSSRFTADLAQTFSRAAQACAQECGRHSQSHCQECASVLPQAAQAAQQLPMMGSGMQQGMGQQAQQMSQQPPQ